MHVHIDFAPFVYYFCFPVALPDLRMIDKPQVTSLYISIILMSQRATYDIDKSRIRLAFRLEMGITSEESSWETRVERRGLVELFKLLRGQGDFERLIISFLCLDELGTYLDIGLELVDLDSSNDWEGVRVLLPGPCHGDYSSASSMGRCGNILWAR